MFPLQMSVAIVVSLLNGEDSMEPDMLADDFLLHLWLSERNVVKAAMDQDTDRNEEDEEDSLNILDRFGCRKLPSKQEIRLQKIQTMRRAACSEV